MGNPLGCPPISPKPWGLSKASYLSLLGLSTCLSPPGPPAFQAMSTFLCTPQLHGQCQGHGPGSLACPPEARYWTHSWRWCPEPQIQSPSPLVQSRSRGLGQSPPVPVKAHFLLAAPPLLVTYSPEWQGLSHSLGGQVRQHSASEDKTRGDLQGTLNTPVAGTAQLARPWPHPHWTCLCPEPPQPWVGATSGF